MHLITVNDYLAHRDAEWMGQLHRFLGLSVGIVIPDDSTPEQKRALYDCDITYGTNNEFGFDYLRDNMVTASKSRCSAATQQRCHRTTSRSSTRSTRSSSTRPARRSSSPARSTDAAELYYQFARDRARRSQRERDYEVDEAKRTVVPTEEGIGRVEQALGVENLYDHVNQNYVHQIQQALRAKELFKRDIDYIIADGEVKIVDEFTGRILEGRRWSEGLHQAVEAKEGVHIKEENQTLATVTLQNYFRHVRQARGHDRHRGHRGRRVRAHLRPPGGADPDEPADGPRRQRRLHLQDRGREVRRAVVDDIAERHEKGQPVLVGTISVEKSEKLSRLLEKRGIPHEVLNAKQHEREAEIIAQAGRLLGVTVATNMAGRGVDILLGGNPEGLARRECMREGLESTRPSTRLATRSCSRFQDECKVEGERSAASAACTCSAPSATSAPHRQPAPGPLRPPGRPGREPLLPLARRRADACCSPPASCSG